MEKKKNKYTVKLDCLIPATMEFTILAASPEEALKILNTQNHPHHLKMGKRKPLKAKVFVNGTIKCIYTKTY